MHAMKAYLQDLGGIFRQFPTFVRACRAGEYDTLGLFIGHAALPATACCFVLAAALGLWELL